MQGQEYSEPHHSCLLVHPGDAPVILGAQGCDGREESQTRSSPYCNRGKFLCAKVTYSHLSFLMWKPAILWALVQLAWP